MFTNDIVGSDAFLEMPSTSQTLYFHLGMRSDDDGFVNPNVTMRMIGANKNDLDILIAKRFVLQFSNGVLVIKHHRMNNNWDSRDSKRTVYTEEFAQLFIKENKAYTLDSEQGNPVEQGYRNIPRRLSDGKSAVEEIRLEENRREESTLFPVAKATVPTQKRFIKPTTEEVLAYCTERNNGIPPQQFVDYYESNGWKVGRNPMKDWKAAVRTWEKNGYSHESKEKTSVGVDRFPQ